MSRLTTLFSFAVVGLASLQSWAQQPAASPSGNEVLIKNAVVMTVTHGNIQNGTVYIKDGKIAAVGERRERPSRRHRDRCRRKISHAGHHRFALAHCTRRRRERGHQSQSRRT